MNETLKKIIYILLYGLIIVAFIYLGNKDYNKITYTNDAERFHEDYNNIPKINKFEYLNSTELIAKLNNGSGIIFIGDKENEWSKKYAYLLNQAVNNTKIDLIYYYDARKVKVLKNRNYYDIIKALEGNLIETDDSENNLFTPSLYIIKNGEVVFHDSTSAVVNNEDQVDEFWTKEKEELFINNIINVINYNY